MQSFIVIKGTITEGFILYGPFKAWKKANAFVDILDRDNCEIILLEDPMK